VLGLFISYFGAQLKLFLEDFLKIALPISLILFGIYFLYRHHTHHHFHIDAQKLNEKNDNDYAIIFSIMGIMFFSPCLEIVPYFLMAGANGIPSVILLSIIFLAVSISGMLLWMFLVYEGTKKMNWHFIEHNAGLITGIILILTGVLSYYSGH
jgi:heme/copper-type cytochrome/quinol oxidase subunit 4